MVLATMPACTRYSEVVFIRAQCNGKVSTSVLSSLVLNR